VDVRNTFGFRRRIENIDGTGVDCLSFLDSFSART
jgi:hypothetical protein